MFLVAPLSVKLANKLCSQNCTPAALSLSPMLPRPAVFRALTRGSIQDIREVLEQEANSSKVNMALRHLASLGLTRQERRQRHKCFHEAITLLQGDKTNALAWLRTNIDSNLGGVIISDINFNNTCAQRLQDKSADLVEAAESSLVKIIKSLVTAVKYLVAGVKDMIARVVRGLKSVKAPKLNCFASNNSSTSYINTWSTIVFWYVTSCISTGSKIIFSYLMSLMSKKTVLVLVLYIDLVKDSTLQVTLTLILGRTLITDFTSVVSQLYWLLLLSIIAPLASSALATAYKEPFLVLGQRSWQYHQDNNTSKLRLWSMRSYTFVLYFWVPAFLLEAQEDAMTRRMELLEEGKRQFQDSDDSEISEEILKEGEKVTKYLEVVGKNLVMFKRNELSIEAIMQLAIQTTMLLLSLQSSTTKYGLEAVFKVNFEEKKGWLSWAGLEISQVLLISSIAWSLTTTARTFIKIKTHEKNQFLPILSRCVLAMRALLVSTCRIFTILTYFGPFLGVLGTLAHHTAEKLSLRKETFMNLTSDFEYWDNYTGRTATVASSLLFRSNYTGGTPIPPEATSYTGISLQTAYFLFLSLLTVQALIILPLKIKISKKFSEASWGSKLQHVVECLSLPETFSDWDDAEGSVEDLRKQRREVFKEILATSSLQFITNMLLLLPLFFAGRKLGATSR